ncbi:hypothetical protein EVAR_49352_1 [Eumeta japonica]|uniref:Uncharacterized protein n=1 Tax=Eumeta variegata TaxID=151549 RepID=A0A4C1XV77_EUMVA|nr:hypothetical protein EVAR_49352_1 [Eumeta japonica]
MLHRGYDTNIMLHDTRPLDRGPTTVRLAVRPRMSFLPSRPASLAAPPDRPPTNTSDNRFWSAAFAVIDKHIIRKVQTGTFVVEEQIRGSTKIDGDDSKESESASDSGEDGSAEDDDDELRPLFKMPVQFDLDELAGAFLANNQKGRMNCVVERRHDDPMERRFPFNLLGAFAPRSPQAERIAIICHGGDEPRPINFPDPASQVFAFPLSGPARLPLRPQPEPRAPAPDTRPPPPPFAPLANQRPVPFPLPTYSGPRLARPAGPPQRRRSAPAPRCGGRTNNFPLNYIALAQ